MAGKNNKQQEVMPQEHYETIKFYNDQIKKSLFLE